MKVKGRDLLSGWYKNKDGRCTGGGGKKESGCNVTVSGSINIF